MALLRGRLLALALAISLSTILASSASATEVLQESLRAIARAGTHGQNLVVVGENGLVLTSRDGSRWQEQRPTQAWLSAVAFNGNVGWVVGQRGTLLHSDDGGLSWRSPNFEGWCFLRTRDHGQTREVIDKSTWKSDWNSDLHTVWVESENVAWVAGDGIILRLDKELRRLDVVHQEPSGVIRQLVFAGTTAWAVGDAGLILRSDDGGRVWKAVKHRVVGRNTVVNYYGVRFLNARLGFVWGSQGALLETRDGGTTWSAVRTVQAVTEDIRGLLVTADGSYAVTPHRLARVTAKTEGPDLLFRQPALARNRLKLPVENRRLTAAMGYDGGFLAVGSRGLLARGDWDGPAEISGIAVSRSRPRWQRLLRRTEFGFEGWVGPEPDAAMPAALDLLENGNGLGRLSWLFEDVTPWVADGVTLPLVTNETGNVAWGGRRLRRRYLVPPEHVANIEQSLEEGWLAVFVGLDESVDPEEQLRGTASQLEVAAGLLVRNDRGELQLRSGTRHEGFQDEFLEDALDNAERYKGVIFLRFLD